jgi:hypothetical protein
MRHCDLSVPDRYALTHAYSKLVRDKKAEGYKVYALALMFKQLPGKRSTHIAIMTQEVERIHSTLAEWSVRHGGHSGYHDLVPIFIGCPDQPVAKRLKCKVRDGRVNAGLHVHVVALFPRKSPLLRRLRKHFRDHEQLYLQNRRTLHRIEVTPITETPENFTDYAFKTLKAGKVAPDEIIILTPGSARAIKSDC